MRSIVREIGIQPRKMMTSSTKKYGKLCEAGFETQRDEDFFGQGLSTVFLELSDCFCQEVKNSMDQENFWDAMHCKILYRELYFVIISTWIFTVHALVC